MIYHWTTPTKALTALRSNALRARRWKHFLEHEQRFATGTSWSQSATRWADHDNSAVCLIADPTRVSNAIHSINGHRTYLLTQGLTKKDRDPTAYTHEPTTPDEEFIEGTISPLYPILTAIWTYDPNPELVAIARQIQIPILVPGP